METIPEDQLVNIVFFCPHHRFKKSIPLNIHESQALYSPKSWHGKCPSCKEHFTIGKEEKEVEGVVHLKIQPSMEREDFNKWKETRKLRNNRIYFGMMVIGYIISFAGPALFFPGSALDFLISMMPSSFWILVSFMLFKDKITRGKNG